jgi:hypothetical protein
MMPKLLQRILHNGRVLGFQTVTSGGAGNGAAGGQKQNMFLHNIGSVSIVSLNYNDTQ